MRAPREPVKKLAIDPTVGSATHAVSWLLAVWLLNRLKHKLNELRDEYKKADENANGYHLLDLSRLVHDCKRGLSLLQRTGCRQKAFLARARCCEKLVTSMELGFSQPWSRARKDPGFVREMRKLVKNTIRKLENDLAKLDHEGSAVRIN